MEGRWLSGQHGQNQGPDTWTKLDMLQKSDKDPCTVCLKDVSTNSGWVHKRSIGISCTLKPDTTFRYKRCIGLTRPVDGRPMTEVTVVREKLDVVWSFCYLGESLSSGGSCELASIRRCSVAWGKFKFKFQSPTEKETIHASQVPCSVQERTWATDLVWSASPAGCAVTTKNPVSSQDHKARMQLDDLAEVLHTYRLRWHGHVKCSDDWITKVQKLDPVGSHGCCRHKKT